MGARRIRLVMWMKQIKGRVIKAGRGEGIALVSSAPVGFLGGVDPETGVVIEKGHPLEGRSVRARVLVFPTGKGSTVGSYTIYRLARNGVAPAAIVNAESEAIVAVGAIISGIPMVDRVDIEQIHDGDRIVVENGTITVERTSLCQAGRIGHHGQEKAVHTAPRSDQEAGR
jgi:predicted aconitase with swiveling domain